MPRKILHLDLDAFFCAVEEHRDPTLRGQPFAVGGQPDQRGVVASCSYAARQRGIRSALPMARAVKLCPGLIIVPSTTLTRQVTLERPTNLDSDIYVAAGQLFEQSWPPGQRVRLIGVGVSGFETTAYQLGLWQSDPQPDRRLQATLDALRDRFGDQAIQRASRLKGAADRDND